MYMPIDLIYHNGLITMLSMSRLFSALVQGLIKIRGDQCWRDLTCMNYHYEVRISFPFFSVRLPDSIPLVTSHFQTQPVPNPLSYYLHHSPEMVHQLETLGNHFVELIAPFFIFLPRPFQILGGALQILFQVSLIARPYLHIQERRLHFSHSFLDRRMGVVSGVSFICLVNFIRQLTEMTNWSLTCFFYR